jgi:hypothetical protein
MGVLHIILKVGHPKIISTQISEQKILMWYILLLFFQSYIINVTEDKTHRSWSYQTAKTNNLTMYHQIKNQLKRGANYTFMVKNNVAKGRWSKPQHIEVCKYYLQLELSPMYFLTWCLAATLYKGHHVSSNPL